MKTLHFDYRFKDWVENLRQDYIVNEICGRCPEVFNEVDTGYLSCPADFDYDCSDCRRAHKISETNIFFAKTLLPLLEENLSNED